MRFSTVAAVSAAALASSTVAIPILGYEHDLVARADEQTLLQLRALFDDETDLFSRGRREKKSAQSTSVTAHTEKHAGVTKKLTTGQQGQTDLTSAGKQNKKAETDLGGSYKGEKHASGELGMGGGSNHNIGASTGQVAKSKRALNIEFEELAERGFLDDDDEIFMRDPGAHTPATPKTPNFHGRPDSSQPKPKQASHNAKTPTTAHGTAQKKLTAQQQGQHDVSNARKVEKHESGFGGATAAQKKTTSTTQGGKATSRRSLDIEDILEELAARGFFDEDDELFMRGPPKSGSTTPAPAAAKAPISKPSNPPHAAKAKASAPATPNPSKAKTPTAAPSHSPKAKKAANKRALDVDEIMEIIARGYYGDFDEY